MEITIRKMEVTDWREVSEIYQQGMDTNLATFQVVCPSYEEWDSWHLPFGRLVAVCGERVSGFAVLLYCLLQSGIMSDNAASIRLHEKCGFRMVGYRERIGRDRFGHGIEDILQTFGIME